MKLCIRCGKEYETGFGRHCSRSCACRPKECKDSTRRLLSERSIESARRRGLRISSEPETKTCPKCGVEHTKNGIYCSRRCANGHFVSEDLKLKIRDSVLEYLRSEGITPVSERPKPEITEPEIVTGVRRRRKEWPDWGLASNGYWLLKVPEDYLGKRYSQGSVYAYEHRIIAEQNIGRLLVDGEVIDHINGDKTDQRIENLQILTPSEHAKKTFRELREKRGPLPPNTECSWCGNQFRTSPYKLTSNRWLFCCRPCQHSFQKSIGFNSQR